MSSQTPAAGTAQPEAPSPADELVALREEVRRMRADVELARIGMLQHELDLAAIKSRIGMLPPLTEPYTPMRILPS